jgi:hypothetical protein
MNCPYERLGRGELFSTSISADGYRTYLEFFQFDRKAQIAEYEALKIGKIQGVTF